MRWEGPLVAAVAMLATASSGCALVAGIDDVHLVEDASSSDTSVSFDADLDGARDDGLRDSTLDAADSGDATVDVADVRDDVSGGDADAAPDVPTGPSCPPLAHGQTMVRITAPGPSYYCIDAHEVSNEELNEYLADLAKPYDSHPACASAKDSTRPTPKTTPGLLKRPANGVNYCYAWAYCKWAGKRLCGHIGGGHASSDAADVNNEWYYACANGLKESVYPYGASYVGATCNTEATGTFTSAMLVDVASKTDCHGIDPGHKDVFDMSGNVWEFDDYASSYDATATSATVHSHGGAANAGATEGACGTNNSFGLATPFGDVGFRCCADARP